MIETCAGRRGAVLILAAALWTAAGPGVARARQGAPPAREGAPTAPARATPAQKQIAEDEAALEQLAALEQELREAAAADEEIASGRLEEVAALEEQLAEAEPGSEEAGNVFDRAKELVVGAVADLRAAIGRAEAPSAVPDFGRRLAEGLAAFATTDRPATGGAVSSAELARLEELYELREEKTRKLEELEARLQEESRERHGAYASRLWQLGLDSLEQLPDERRDRLSSLTRERWDEILYDFDVARLVAEVQWFRLRKMIADLPSLLRDFFAAVTVGGALFRVMLVVLLWRWAQRRRPGVLERLRRRAADHPRARVAAELVAAAAPWGIFLLGLAALHWALGPKLSDLPIIGPLIFVLAAIYGAFRLADDLVVGVLLAGAEHTAFEVTPERRRRLGRSVRRVLIVAVVMFLLPAFYFYRLEGGVLYDALREIARWVVLAATLVELATWRRELADACLAMRSAGGWANLQRRTRDRPFGVLLAPFSFLWLAGRGLWALGQEIASGYAGTRLATTYLARRRIEKEAEERGYADVSIDSLPAGLVEALDERVRPGDAVAADTIPGLEAACRSVAQWRRGEGGGAFLLAGEQGIGKRAWIDRFCAREPVAARLRLDRRLTEPRELIDWLARHLLGEGETVASRSELAERLGAGERSIVVLEGAENLFLARVDGYRALAEMAALAGETRLEVFWMLSMEGLAFNHLRATAKELTYLGHVAELPDWPEKRIRELLLRRLAAGGFTANWAELLGAAGSGEDAEARRREGETAFISLLSDFADGNPQVALHYFLRSLVPGGNGSRAELTVRPFRPPPESQLADMRTEAFFLLAAVARHGNLTLEEASSVSGYPPALAGILLTRLLDLGALAADGERYRVTSHWQPTVFRLLRRRNVLVS
ncbi:MAG: hypothetical protein GY719_20300 [bacterium]|nr:hypothetical protein [bacterium]